MDHDAIKYLTENLASELICSLPEQLTLSNRAGIGDEKP
jgi:hypothetical protein